MWIKPKYQSEADTPMRFYHAHRILAPLSAVIRLFAGASQILASWDAVKSAGWPADGIAWFGLDLFFQCGAFILLCLAAAGLQRMAWSGVLATFGYLVLYALNRVVYYWGASPGSIIGCILGPAIIALPMYVYYAKRRLLFSPAPGAKSGPTPPKPQAHDDQPASSQKPSVPKVAAPQPVESAEQEAEQMVLPEFAPPVVEPKEKRPFPFRALCAALVVLCGVSLVGNAVLYRSAAEAKTELAAAKKVSDDTAELTAQVESLTRRLNDKQKIVEAREDKILDLLAEVDTLSDCARFVYDDGTRLYHSFDCSECPFETYSSFYGFWCHNEEYCDYLGLSPCPDCI